MKEIIDLETFAKEGKSPCKGVLYQIRIDKDQYVVENELITGRELLKLAGKYPIERYQINQKHRSGAVQKIPYDKEVDLTECGIERFMTIPLDQTEGTE